MCKYDILQDVAGDILRNTYHHMCKTGLRRPSCPDFRGFDTKGKKKVTCKQNTKRGAQMLVLLHRFDGYQIDGLVQESRNSSALAIELLLSSTNLEMS